MTDITAPRRDRILLSGRRESAEAYEIRDFLKRSVVAFDWLETGATADVTKIRFPDGTELSAPTLRDVADRLGFIAAPKYSEYDLSIYGAGPAGLAAAVYAASEGLRTVLLERSAVGGQAGSSSLIENYLGFPAGIAGADLAERARQQAVKFGVDLVMMREGVRAEFHDDRIHADLADGGRMVAKANICATGVEWRRLGVPNEERLLGAGVYYGAGASEAPLCAGEHVFIIGGGNSAGQATMDIASHAAKVSVVVRDAVLAASMSQYLSTRLEAASNVELLFQTEVVGLDGDARLRSVELRDRVTGSTRWCDTGHLFVAIGGQPNSDWAKDTPIVRNELGYLVTGPDLLVDGSLPRCWPLERDPFYLETSVPGSFAAGDVRLGSIKRVATAAGEGAMAVAFVHRYLSEL